MASGYCTCQIDSGAGSIGLVALARHAQGRMLGRHLIGAATSYFSGHGIAAGEGGYPGKESCGRSGSTRNAASSPIRSCSGTTSGSGRRHAHDAVRSSGIDFRRPVRGRPFACSVPGRLHGSWIRGGWRRGTPGSGFFRGRAQWSDIAATPGTASDYGAIVPRIIHFESSEPSPPPAGFPGAAVRIRSSDSIALIADRDASAEDGAPAIHPRGRLCVSPVSFRDIPILI